MTDSTDLRAFVQARMTSRRFPGKVLAPFRGRPLIAHVIDAVARALPRERIVVATSTHATDDPLAAFARDLGVIVFRGPLDDVFERFRMCLDAHPCTWFFRVSADSPLFDNQLLTTFLGGPLDGVDIVTNVSPRTFPRGHSLEMIRGETFAGINPRDLADDEREHVTPYFYRRPDRFRIANIESGDPARAAVNLCVDTVEDLRRLEEAP